MLASLHNKLNEMGIVLCVSLPNELIQQNGLQGSFYNELNK